MKSKHTKGEYGFANGGRTYAKERGSDGYETGVAVSQNGSNDAVCLAFIYGDTVEESKANAALLIDAGNTFQQSSLLPSELLERNIALMSEMQRIANLYDNVEDTAGLIARTVLDKLHR